MYRKKERKGCWQVTCWELEFQVLLEEDRFSYCLLTICNNCLSLFSIERGDVSAVKDLIHKTLYFPEKQQQSSPSQCQDPAGPDSSAHYTVIQDPV